MNAEPIVRMENIHKSFGEVKALKGVDFNVRREEIRGLVGDNGAGKSTLIKVLTGVYPADKGKIFYKGKETNISSPQVARKMGIETVYQDQALAPQQSIARNIFMGAEPTKRFGLLDEEEMWKKSQKVLRKIGFLRIGSPDEKVMNLSGGEREGVAIARVLLFDADIALLDEPTIALSIKEAQRVLKFVQNLRDEGLGVVFITHNLEHVYSIADRFTVLAQGERVVDIEKGKVSKGDLGDLIAKGKDSDVLDDLEIGDREG